MGQPIGGGACFENRLLCEGRVGSTPTPSAGADMVVLAYLSAGVSCWYAHR